MKLSDNYFSQNQCIYGMDTVKGFTIVPTHYYFLMTSSTQLEEYMHYK